jgi:TolB-like protein/tetratricopeptide (TPR) repeat protein
VCPVRWSPLSVRFGAFEVDLQARELRKQGLRIRVEEKPLCVLELLLERPGHVVTRHALRERLWPDTTVGYEHGLNTAMNKLRELLGDSAQSPRFIETLPRRGYRFIAPVEKPSAPPSATKKLMLAVLPFENLSGNPDQEYFADGLTEELISQLGQLNPKSLGVIARTSAIQYKNTKKSIAEIARELSVDCVLEGSVRREGSRLRIAAQLIDADDQTHLWSATYDRRLRGPLSVQQEVAREVGKALAVELLPDHGAGSAAPDPKAHEAYLRGRFFWGRRSEEELRKAIACFEEALAIDPSVARAHSGIADCYSLLCWFGALSPREAGPKAAVAAARARELGDSLSVPHASLGLVRLWYEWDWKGAEDEFLRAIELNPSYASAHHWYAALLNAMGRLDEAQIELDRARELDPHSLIINMSAADPLFFARQFDRAIEHLRALLDHEPRFFPALYNLGRAYVHKGMYDDAITAFEQAVKFSGNREGYPALAHAYALAGREDEARKILDEMKTHTNGRYVAAPLLAHIHFGLGEFRQAFEMLRKGVEERSYWMVFLKVDPIYYPVRADRRFQDLLRQVGFRA